MGQADDEVYFCSYCFEIHNTKIERARKKFLLGFISVSKLHKDMHIREAWWIISIGISKFLSLSPCYGMNKFPLRILCCRAEEENNVQGEMWKFWDIW